MLDDAAHVADQLVDQRQAQPLPVALAGNEGIEQHIAEMLRHAGAIVGDDDLHRQRLLPLAVARVPRQAVAIGGGQPHGQITFVFSSFTGILDKIEQYLHQRVMIGEDARQ